MCRAAAKGHMDLGRASFVNDGSYRQNLSKATVGYGSAVNIKGVRNVCGEEIELRSTITLN